jgi:hypothetical protein
MGLSLFLLLINICISGSCFQGKIWTNGNELWDEGDIVSVEVDLLKVFITFILFCFFKENL